MDSQKKNVMLVYTIELMWISMNQLSWHRWSLLVIRRERMLMMIESSLELKHAIAWEKIAMSVVTTNEKAFRQHASRAGTKTR